MYRDSDGELSLNQGTLLSNACVLQVHLLGLVIVKKNGKREHNNVTFDHKIAVWHRVNPANYFSLLV